MTAHPIHRVQAASALVDHLLIAATRALDHRPAGVLEAREYLRLARHTLAAGLRAASETGAGMQAVPAAAVAPATPAAAPASATAAGAGAGSRTAPPLVVATR